MEEASRAFFILILFTLGACGLCNIFSLLYKPHKWCELLIFPQLGWCLLGLLGIEGFSPLPQTEMLWYLETYGYPILLFPIQFFAWKTFFSLYKEQKQENEKYLYLAISQIVSMMMLSLFWIMLRYVVGWAYAT